MGHGNSAKSYIISLDQALEGLARICNSEQGNTLIVSNMGSTSRGRKVGPVSLFPENEKRGCSILGYFHL